MVSKLWIKRASVRRNVFNDNVYGTSIIIIECTNGNTGLFYNPIVGKGTR